MRLTTHIGTDRKYWWTIVRSDADPQPVARGTLGYADVDACAQAAQFVALAPHTAARPAPQPGGGWRWVIDDEDGRVVAESAVIFGHEAACGYALYEVRKAISGLGARTP